MPDIKRCIISSSEKVQIISENNVEQSYRFNEKEIEASPDNKVKIQKTINEIVNRFCSQYENTLILTGAGSSILIENDLVESGIDVVNLAKHSGKSMWMLRDDIQDSLSTHFQSDLNAIAELVKYQFRLPENKEDFNLEDLLTRVDVAREFITTEDLDNFNDSINHMEAMIRANCTLELCNAHPHKLFLEKLTARKNNYNRIKIYTTNYDTLFEDAAEEGGFILVDGFSFSKNRKFSSKHFDYDIVERQGSKIPDEPKYISKVVYLMKIHGSIDWALRGNDVYKVAELGGTESLMIYPRRAKFEQSYEKPYFELFSRFQNDLKQPNTLLIVIGFSFADKHIRSIVEEAVKSNPGLKILIVDVNIDKDDYQFFIDRASKFEDVMLYSNSFKGFVENVYKKQVAYSDELFEGGERE